MEASPNSGSKQAPLRNDNSLPSSFSEEEEKFKVPGQLQAPAAPTPYMEQGQGGSVKEKDELFRRQFVMPEYLRVAMAAAVESKLANYPGSDAPPLHSPPQAPECPLIVMINSRSGGRQGPALRSVLNDLLSNEQGDANGSPSDVTAASFEGVFYNYFSIGMDAQVAYGFHNLRERQPYLARGPISNKLVYSSCGCAQGWFCTPCSTNPRVRGLYNIMHLYVRREANGDWERVDLPHNVRAVIMLNLQSYASGRNPWGHPKNEYNQKRHFVQPSSNDGLLEIFGLFDGWHTSLVMLSLRSAKRLAQACAIRMELIADQRHRIYMQMDGEPWRQPLSENENSTVIEITHVPTHSLMLKAT